VPSPGAIKFINKVGVPRKGGGRQRKALVMERMRLHQERLMRLARLQDHNAS
jgi:hypothetical protein